MDFDYTSDQKALREEARRFLASVAPLSAARTVLEEPKAAYNQRVWRTIAEQGWLGAAIPETLGGLGLGDVELGAIAEEIGASLAPIPFGSTLYVLAKALLFAGSPKQQAALLPKIARGEIIGCGAFFEGDAMLDYANLATRWEAGRLTGRKLPVIDGSIAHFAVVTALGPGGPALFLVELDQTAVEIVQLEAVDGSIGVAELIFDGAAAEPLPLGVGQAALDRLLATAAVFYAFEQIGGAERCLRNAIAYVTERHAFGGPVGRFQAVKHNLATMFADIEIARSHAYHGVWAIGQDDDTLFPAAAAARIAASDAYWSGARDALHLHGAIGFTWEHDSQLFYRRAHHLSLAMGDSGWWKDRLFPYLNRR